MDKIERRTFNITTELRVDAEQKARGHAAMFNSDSYDLGGFVERIAPGAFTRSLQEASAGKLNIYALWAHDTSQPLGSTRSGKLDLSEDDQGLAFEMITARMTPAQLDTLADGDLQMSFGFSVRDQEWREHDDGTVERTLKDVHLSEISFVINPAYPDTSAALRSMSEWRSASRVEEQPTELEPDFKNDATRKYLMREVERRLR